MQLSSLAALIPLSCLCACSMVAPASAERNAPPAPLQAAAPAAPAPAPAPASAASAFDAASIAALRAEGPPALARLLARYDALQSGPSRDALAGVIDRVAAQRYATRSRLYWYTDLAAAEAAARASGKPILSLRMLGHLDEDLSCANSRMFRTILYPDAAVSQLLRDRFVLHWSSERPVPVVTIDYGDGRTLSTTVTGNSAHYVLDADGHVLDVLPGMYAPSVFRAELARAADLAARVGRLEPAARVAAVAAYHRDAAASLARRWGELGSIAVIGDSLRGATQAELESAAALAQRATISKAYIEVPLIRQVDLGVDPGTLPDDLDLRVATAARLFGFTLRRTAAAGSGDARDGLLDDRARALVVSLFPAAITDQDAALFQVERTVAADTLLDETVLRPAIRAQLLVALDGGALPALEPMNAWVYAEVFKTPATDPWLGLLPANTYTGLPGGAVVSQR